MTQHICFVAPRIYPSLSHDAHGKLAGGAEIQQVQIARLLLRDGWRVSILTCDFGQPDQQDIDGLTVYKLPSFRRGLKGLRWLSPRLTDVVAALRRIGPDIVYVRTATAYAAPAAWYARHHGARFVFAGASDSNFKQERDRDVPFREWQLYRWGLKRAHLILTQNHAQAQDVAAHLTVPAALCPNFFIDTAALPGRADGPVIWVGSIRAMKRPELFVELARRLPQRHFLLVGGAQSDAAAQAVLARLQQAAAGLPNLELCGHVPPQEVGRLYDGAAALINTSTHEGFPNTFLQAWLRGVPTLSFVKPEVAPGSSGTLAVQDVDAMAAALDALLAPAAWPQHSARVRAHFQQYHSMETARLRYQQLLGAGVAT